MKQLLLLFLLPFFLVLQSLELSAVQLEDKGGSVQVLVDKKGGTFQVIVDKNGETLAQLDIPEKYLGTGQTAIEISLLNTKNGQLFFSTKGIEGQSFNFPNTASGVYLLRIAVNGYNAQILVSL